MPPLHALSSLRQRSYWIEHTADGPCCRAQASGGGGGHRSGLLAQRSCNMMRELRGRALHRARDCLCLPPLRALASLRQRSYWIEHTADGPCCRAQASGGGGGHRSGLIAQQSAGYSIDQFSCFTSFLHLRNYGSRSRFYAFRLAPPQRERWGRAHHGNHGIKTWPALPARGPSPAREMDGVWR